MKKNYLIDWGISAVMVISALNLNLSAQQTQKLPNIIFIMADDMGYGDVKAFNPESKIETPHLDKLAASGMMFTDAHVPGSSCVTSRYGLLTGRYPFRAESLNWQSKPLIEENRWTIAAVLKKNGYHTGMVGKWHLGFDYTDYNNLTGGPVDRGFDYYFGISRSLDQADYYYIENKHVVQPPTEDVAASEGYGKNGWQGSFWREGKIAPDFKHDEVLSDFTQKSIEFIRGAADSSSPFFLYLALASPHTPWLASERFKGTSDAGDYGDWVSENDNSIGAVIQAVYDNGLREKTLIFFTSDNGPVWWPVDIETYGHRATSLYRGMKFDAWEGGHRMPFIASWPGVIEPNSRCAQIISTTDMFATFTALVGESLPDNVAEDSYSILDALYDKDIDKPIREAFVGRPDNTDLFIRQGDWKLIGNDRLYNLASDPSENENVYINNQDIATKLSGLLEKYKADGRSTPVPITIPLKSELIDVWDAEKVRARSPLLIAHRGGVVGQGTPECSQKAVRVAAVHSYDMVELDVMETLDHHPVVFHDENMLKACGVERKISTFTVDDIKQIRFLNSDETITSLEIMLGLCRSLNLGVMFDIKPEKGSDLFYKRILKLIGKYNLDKACMTLGNSRTREYLKGKVLLTLSEEMLEKVEQGISLNLHGFYWFGVPKSWPIDLVKPVQKNGALVIPAINTFRYAEENHRAEARHDVERLLKAGVDGFQIDCIYQDYLGRSKIQETK